MLPVDLTIIHHFQTLTYYYVGIELNNGEHLLKLAVIEAWHHCCMRICHCFLIVSVTRFVSEFMSLA